MNLFENLQNINEDKENFNKSKHNKNIQLEGLNDYTQEEIKAGQQISGYKENEFDSLSQEDMIYWIEKAKDNIKTEDHLNTSSGEQYFKIEQDSNYSQEMNDACAVYKYYVFNPNGDGDGYVEVSEFDNQDPRYADGSDEQFMYQIEEIVDADWINDGELKSCFDDVGTGVIDGEFTKLALESMINSAFKKYVNECLNNVEESTEVAIEVVTPKTERYNMKSDLWIAFEKENCTSVSLEDLFNIFSISELNEIYDELFDYDEDEEDLDESIELIEGMKDWSEEEIVKYVADNFEKITKIKMSTIFHPQSEDPNTEVPMFNQEVIDNSWPLIQSFLDKKNISYSDDFIYKLDDELSKYCTNCEATSGIGSAGNYKTSAIDIIPIEQKKRKQEDIKPKNETWPEENDIDDDIYRYSVENELDTEDDYNSALMSLRQRYGSKELAYAEGIEKLKENIDIDFSTLYNLEPLYFKNDKGGKFKVIIDQFPMKPEDYDEGYKPEYGGSEEELSAAQLAYDNGEVFDIVEIDSGDVVGIAYGEDDLIRGMTAMNLVPAKTRTEVIFEGSNESKEKYISQIDGMKSKVDLVNLLHKIRDNKGLNKTDKDELEKKIQKKVKTTASTEGETESIVRMTEDVDVGGYNFSSEDIQSYVDFTKENPDDWMDDKFARPCEYNGKTYYIIYELDEADVTNTIGLKDKESIVCLVADDEYSTYLAYFSWSPFDKGDGESGPIIDTDLNDNPDKVEPIGN